MSFEYVRSRKHIHFAFGTIGIREHIQSLWNVCKRPITRYIENLQSHSTLEILFFIYNLLVQFLTMANKLLELLFLRKTLHLATSPKDR